MQRAVTLPGVTLRRETPADREFLCGLYASTRLEELAPTGWSDAEKLAFLRSQFEAQSTHYAKHYYDAEFWIIERAGTPIGRLYVYRTDPADVRIVDIALLPSSRGSGIGTELLRAELDAARALGKTVSVHCERFNPALRLYRRLGFEPVGETGVYYLLRWSGHRSAGASYPTAT